MAAAADGQVLGAWTINGTKAAPWIPTSPQLTSVAAIDRAFGLPDTATATVAPVVRQEGSGDTGILLVGVGVAGAVILLFAMSRRRTT